MTDTREVMEMAQQPVAYLAWRDGKPCYAGEDVVCADPVWPVDSDDDRTSMPVYAGAAPAAQSDDKDLLTIAAMDAYQMGKRDALAQQGEQQPVAWLHAKTNQAFTSEPPPSLKARCTPLYTGAAPEAQQVEQDRATRIGMYVLKTAKSLGWKDDGEGAHEYIQRLSYSQGVKDAPAAQPDARKVIEQMAGALENAVPTNWSNSSTDEHRNAIQAGQKWLEENMAGDGGPHAIESAHSITGGAG